MAVGPGGRPRRGRRAVLWCLITSLAGVVVMAGVMAARSGASGSASLTVPSAGPTTEVTVSATPSPRATAKKRRSTGLSKTARSRLTGTLSDYLDGRTGRLAITARDLSTGVTFGYGTKLKFPTASIVKVDILAALLLKAQRAGRTLTTSEKSTATRMIEYSDNKAANALWAEIGGTGGLTAANRKLGLRSTIAGSGGYWGVTMTSTADQLRLLSALTSKKSPLSARSRAYALGLMGDVISTQDWGVSAGADDGDSVALKNGWLPRATDGGTWVVNSIGRIHGDGHDYLIAVLSDHNTTMDSGVTKVEHVTQLVTKAFGKELGRA
ncbi:MAG: hypothetical protein JWN52_353 [Actinomycetia bacterium]|nr:hypothetical protein [Actinomycetes bacterium]